MYTVQAKMALKVNYNSNIFTVQATDKEEHSLKGMM
jgi:hypothetical protein